MKLRVSGMVTRPFWFIVFVAFVGAGLIYFLNSIGVIEAMRNDNTLDFVYEANVKLPKAPSKLKTVTTADVNVVNKIMSQRDIELAKIQAIVEKSDVKKTQGKSLLSSISTKHESENKFVIPRIIHQTWDTYHIPKSFVNNIKSWVQHHPNWNYWLWTTKAVECFIENFYPKYSVLFDSYPNPTSKADAMRYFILHKYGGIYVDIDTRCLKPMDVWSKHFCCVLTEEPYEHSFIVREENRSSIVNSPMACVADHELFSTAIKSLPDYAGNYFGDYIRSTGPLFLSDMYKTYRRAKYASSTKNNSCQVTVTPPKYFLPRYDPSQSELIDSRCAIEEYKSRPQPQKQVCLNLINRDYKNVVTPSAFMDHDWIHADLLGLKWKSSNTISLFDILPKATNLETSFCKR